MKILMIGLGSIGQRHLRNIRSCLDPETEVIAYRTRGLSRTFSNTMQVRDNVVLEDEYNVKSYTDLSEALAQKPNAAFIANVTKSHIPCAIEAAKAGCHLFLEKPLSDSMDGIDELAEIIREKNLKAFVGFQNRYNPGIQYLKKALSEKQLGQIVSVSASVGERLATMHTYEDYKETYMARKDLGGGVILNQMIHEIDYLRFLFGDPQSVYAVGTSGEKLQIDVDDCCNAVLNYPGTDNGNFSVALHGDFYQYPAERFIQVVGTNGKIHVNMINGTVTKTIANESEEITFDSFERNNMFIRELNSFMDCIEHDTCPEISLADGIKSLSIAMAIKGSMECGGKKCEFF